MTTMTKTAYTDSAEERFARAGARLDDLVKRAKEARTGAVSRFDDVIKTAKEDLDGAKLHLRKLNDARAEAWRHYEAAVDATTKRMEADIAIAEGRMDAELAESREEFEAAMRTQIRGLEGRIDQLRVHAALARMEARDRMDPVLGRVEDRFGLAMARLKGLAAASDSAWATLRTGVQESVDLLKETVEEAGDELD